MNRLHSHLCRLSFLIVCLLPVNACRGQEPAVGDSVGEQMEEVRRQLSPVQDFGALVARLSSVEGYFDTDNLISNESSYLHAVSILRELGLSGGAYLGVGPDQNFSYIAHLRPSIAFILDIRKDNMLLHLLYKALFEMSETRISFLKHLFARESVGASESEFAEWDAGTLLDVVEDSPRMNEGERTTFQSDVIKRIEEFGVILSEEDLQKIKVLHSQFIEHGPALRFTSHGRPPQSYYPTYKQLALEQDLSGEQVGFLSQEKLFLYLKQLHEGNRIIPVVGNFADPHPLIEIGRYLGEINEEVVAFYTSNVEFYLMYQQQFPLFVQNVAQLPIKEDAVMIRSYFNRFRRAHPETVPGYASTQLVQYIHGLTGRPNASYGELISDYIR